MEFPQLLLLLGKQDDLFSCTPLFVFSNPIFKDNICSQYFTILLFTSKSDTQYFATYIDVAEMSHTHSGLQREIDASVQFFEHREQVVDPEKSELICFSRARAPEVVFSRLFSDLVRYLGIFFDAREGRGKTRRTLPRPGLDQRWADVRLL